MLGGNRALATSLRKTVASKRTPAFLAQMKEDTERKVTVEALLRLKRAEGPPAEFWASFESQIRTKQLSAIVSKRPWWDRYSRVFAGFSRHQVSFGAAAALA